MFGLRGSTMIGPVSHPGPLNQFSYGVSPRVVRLGTEIVVLSCCGAYSRYGKALSTVTV